MSWEKVKVPASILNPSFILFKKYWTLSDFLNIDSNNILYFISFFWQLSPLKTRIDTYRIRTKLLLNHQQIESLQYMYFLLFLR